MNRFTPVEVKDRIFKERALLGVEVRKFLKAHPQSTAMQISQAVPKGNMVLWRLLTLGLVKREVVNRKTVWSIASMEAPTGNE